MAIRNLLDVDVADAEQVAQFIDAHGMLNMRVDDLLGARVERPGRRPGRRVEAHVNDARLCLVAARCIAKHWLADQFNEDVVAAWQDLDPVTKVLDEQNAWIAFADYLSRGLKAFHARVEFTMVAPSGSRVALGRPQVGLYSGLCHQLFNLYVAEVPPTKCANANCQHVFVHQSGRATTDQYRSKGVYYCTKACARAQAERQRRRRMKGEPG